MNTHIRKEIRICTVMYGGVSLAIYMNGVAREFYDLVRGRGMWGLLKLLTDTDIAVDITSGTSAGGINGLYLSYALCNELEFNALADMWREKGDIRKLLQKPDDKNVNSLINSTYMRDELEHAFLNMKNINTVSEIAPTTTEELDCFIAVTRFDGHTWEIKDYREKPITLKSYKGNIHLKHRKKRKENFSSKREEGIPAKILAQIARATSSFPFAFEAERLNSKELKNNPWAGKSPLNENEEAWFIDGGVINNRNFEPALKEIYRRHANHPVDRLLFYVEPDPADKQDKPPAHEGPNVLQTAVAALSGIPTYESIAEDIEDLNEHNKKIALFNAIYDPILIKEDQTSVKVSTKHQQEIYNRARLYQMVMSATKYLSADMINSLKKDILKSANNKESANELSNILRTLIKIIKNYGALSIENEANWTKYKKAYPEDTLGINYLDIAFVTRAYYYWAYKLHEELDKLSTAATKDNQEKYLAKTKLIKTIMETEQINNTDELELEIDAKYQKEIGELERYKKAFKDKKDTKNKKIDDTYAKIEKINKSETNETEKLYLKYIVYMRCKFFRAILENVGLDGPNEEWGKIKDESNAIAEEFYENVATYEKLKIEIEKNDPLIKKISSAETILTRRLDMLFFLQDKLARVLEEYNQKEVGLEDIIRLLRNVFRKTDSLHNCVSYKDIETLRDPASIFVEEYREYEKNPDLYSDTDNKSTILITFLNTLTTCISECKSLLPHQEVVNEFQKLDAFQLPAILFGEMGELDRVEYYRISPLDTGNTASSFESLPALAKWNNNDVEKVTGKQLGHFGAILKKSWRVNDIMWGRLDTATILFDVLKKERKLQFGPEYAKEIVDFYVHSKNSIKRLNVLKDSKAHYQALRQFLENDQELFSALRDYANGSPNEKQVAEKMLQSHQRSILIEEIPQVIIAAFDEEIERQQAGIKNQSKHDQETILLSYDEAAIRVLKQFDIYCQDPLLKKVAAKSVSELLAGSAQTKEKGKLEHFVHKYYDVGEEKIGDLDKLDTATTGLHAVRVVFNLIKRIIPDDSVLGTKFEKFALDRLSIMVTSLHLGAVSIRQGLTPYLWAFGVAISVLLLMLRIFVGKPEVWPIWPTLIIPSALLFILLSAPEFWLAPEKLNLGGDTKNGQSENTDDQNDISNNKKKIKELEGEKAELIKRKNSLDIEIERLKNNKNGIWKRNRRAIWGWLIIITLLITVLLTIITSLFEISQISSLFTIVRENFMDYWNTWLRWGILIWGVAWLIIWAIGRIIRWGVVIAKNNMNKEKKG